MLRGFFTDSWDSTLAMAKAATTAVTVLVNSFMGFA